MRNKFLMLQSRDSRPPYKLDHYIDDRNFDEFGVYDHIWEVYYKNTIIFTVSCLVEDEDEIPSTKVYFENDTLIIIEDYDKITETVNITKKHLKNHLVKKRSRPISPPIESKTEDEYKY